MKLIVSNITKSFSLGGKTILVLKEVSFGVQGGEFFTIVGPSGSGKSTLLKIVASLINPTSGELVWDSKPALSFVFQNYALFPYLTVGENIEFGLKMRGMSMHQRKKISKELIDEVGLSGFTDKHPKELSGGMKQRVGIARALAISPDVLCLDEPFSSLDEFTAKNLRKLLLKLWQKRGITIIMITHLIAEAVEMADQIAIMSSAPGFVRKIVENTLSRPRDLRSKQFFDLEDLIKSNF